MASGGFSWGRWLCAASPQLGFLAAREFWWPRLELRCPPCPALDDLVVTVDGCSHTPVQARGGGARTQVGLAGGSGMCVLCLFHCSLLVQQREVAEMGLRACDSTPDGR